ncbi:MAG TPA: aspartate aminotransferase family protein [Verrucomicrobiales bacterium]|nr:aspartate aminotransferase family protein [Verrucomicrobiales bacterium]
MNPHLQLLRDYESRNVTHLAEDSSWPIVWDRAKGVHVWSIDGKKYLDLTAAFAVATTGHANPRVTKAAQAQLAKLPHAMGDVHPHTLKGQLARELSKLTFERWKRGRGKTIFCNSGFEAVEAALKTALLATGKKGVIAFEGAYHGLGYGALTATHREHFRNPFKKQLSKFGHFAPFPITAKELAETETQLKAFFKKHPIGAMLVEPIQGRAGLRVPPAKFLRMLRSLCDQHDALLIYDEIYTGFGRTGEWFACEHSSSFPDLICLGKALTNGFPLSACVGRATVMDRAWPESTGEAIHTSTFLGHPVGCAMALAQVRELKEKKLITQARRRGKQLQKLHKRFPIRGARFVGKGLMAGLAFDESEGPRVFAMVKDMLRRGYILLPAGEHGNVIALTPAFTITEKQLERTLRALQSSFAKS